MANLLATEHEPWFAITSGNNQGWDVTLLEMDGVWASMIPIEVKTSKLKRLQFSHKRERDQLAWYKNLWYNYGIGTWYAFRRMMGTPVNDVRERWRFFHVEQVGKGITWEQGMTYERFVHKLKHDW